MSNKKPIRVIVADDQAIVRSGLAAFLTAFDELEFVGEATDGEEAIQLCEIVRPDVVLMDIKMPNMDGITATRLIHERWQHIKVIALTSYNNQATAQSALDAGAAGYLLKDVSAEELRKSILEVFTGHQVMGEVITLREVEDTTTRDRAKLMAQQTMNQELVNAGKIQSSILPSQPPIIKGWNLTATLEPARQTSGDFFDFIPLANGNLGIVIADVTDKGIGAALFMALSNTLMRTYATQYPALPAFAVHAVNRRILTDTGGGMFVTLFYGVLEPDTGRLRYVNAGHNPPYLVSVQKGKPVDRLTKTGMALGVSDEVTWQQKIIRMIPGDLLLLYTDGITEAQNRYGEYFGEQRLQEIARRKRGCLASELQKSVIEELNNFSGDTPRQDDVTIMVVARRGGS
jgi:sigma-B regulation protein RsbU (phosphoserine phosphatase)